MALPVLDDLERVRFDWPEPLVIELLHDHYAALLPGPRGTLLARQHQMMLRALLDEGHVDRASLRARFAESLRDAGLDDAILAGIEEAVLFELMRVVGQRFRNSPRLRDAYGDQLRRIGAEATVMSAVVAQVASAPRTWRPAVAA